MSKVSPALTDAVPSEVIAADPGATTAIEKVDSAVVAPLSRTTIDPIVAVDVATGRRRWGYGLLTASLVFVVVTAYRSLNAIDGIAPTGDVPSPFDYVRLGVHGAVTVAFLLFCYGLMQAGERMALPAELVRTSEDLRLLLGVKPPVSLMAKEFQKLVKTVAPLIRTVPPKAGD